MPKRIFLVENNQSFRQVMRIMTLRQPDLELCGEAACAEDAIDLILESEPDVALIDLSLPGMSGLDLVRILKERGSSAHCVILSGRSQRKYADEAFAAGAIGYIIKSSPQEIFEGVRRTAEGERFLSRELIGAL